MKQRKIEYYNVKKMKRCFWRYRTICWFLLVLQNQALPLIEHSKKKGKYNINKGEMKELLDIKKNVRALLVL